MNRTPQGGFYLGRNRDFHDSRDQVLRLARLTPESVGEVDTFAGLSLPVYDQGALGSCTANAGVLYRRFLCQKFPKWSANDQDLSRLFLYYAERALPWNNSVNEDSGAMTRDICKVLTQTGVPPEADFPYITEEFTNAPIPNAYTDAPPYKVGAYHRIPDADTLISCLVSGYPSLLGLSLYDSFEDIGPDGWMLMPNKSESVIGGHEMVVRGYSSARNAFKVQNSYGADWGDGGCLWMPYAYLEDQDLSGPDMWITHMGPPWK